jgi:hypothetical protein
MPNAHKLRPAAFRPQPEEHRQAMATLHENGLTMDAFLQACQRYLIADPTAALATLKPFWPPPKDSA